MNSKKHRCFQAALSYSSFPVNSFYPTSKLASSQDSFHLFPRLILPKDRYHLKPS
ncbi:hypothetical protein Peur_000892 [Populus x canadensis]